jgi:hypothetical protein
MSLFEGISHVRHVSPEAATSNPTVSYIVLAISAAIEGWSFLDSLYMTVTTITTVGYGEVHPLSTGGRIFSIFLIVGGVGGALYALTGVIEYIIEGNIGTTWGRRRMKNKIEKFKGHFRAKVTRLQNPLSDEIYFRSQGHAFSPVG